MKLIYIGRRKRTQGHLQCWWATKGPWAALVLISGPSPLLHSYTYFTIIRLFLRKLQKDCPPGSKRSVEYKDSWLSFACLVERDTGQDPSCSSTSPTIGGKGKNNKTKKKKKQACFSSASMGLKWTKGNLVQYWSEKILNPRMLTEGKNPETRNLVKFMHGNILISKHWNLYSCTGRSCFSQSLISDRTQEVELVVIAVALVKERKKKKWSDDSFTTYTDIIFNQIEFLCTWRLWERCNVTFNSGNGVNQKVSA